jgi:hypothetical protein
MKIIKLFFCYTLLLLTGCNAQSSPFAPEAGIYKGGSASVSTSYQYGYNAITGFGVQPATQAQYTPAPMGDLQLTVTSNNKGTYRFSKMSNLAGSWAYSVPENRLTFTGFLQDALLRYTASKGIYTLALNIKSRPEDKNGLQYIYIVKKLPGHFPNQLIPTAP